MSIFMYVETRANEVIQSDVLGTFKDEKERDLVLRQEIDLCIDNGASSNIIKLLEEWDFKSPISYCYDTRVHKFGNWFILPA